MIATQMLPHHRSRQGKTWEVAKFQVCVHNSLWRTGCQTQNLSLIAPFYCILIAEIVTALQHLIIYIHRIFPAVIQYIDEYSAQVPHIGIYYNWKPIYILFNAGLGTKSGLWIEKPRLRPQVSYKAKMNTKAMTSQFTVPRPTASMFKYKTKAEAVGFQFQLAPLW